MVVSKKGTYVEKLGPSCYFISLVLRLEIKRRGMFDTDTIFKDIKKILSLHFTADRIIVYIVFFWLTPPIMASARVFP